MGCGGSKQNQVEAATGSGDAGADGTAAADNAKKAASKSKGSNAKAEQEPLKKGNQEDIRDKYDLGKVLGSGSFGQVREARLKENADEVRAVKMIEPDKGDGEWSNQAIFVREVGLLQQMKHENIIRYYDFYEDIHFLYVVMELCKGGEVFAKIVELKRFSEKNAAHLSHQMLKALDYIHKLFVAHRDIKAENFMLSENSVHSNVKMIDFGMATKFKPDQVLTELCGSPHYLSPELIGQKYNHMADVWAFGVLLYLLMYGHYPYDAKHPRDIMVKILTEPIEWESKTKAKLSSDAIDFLKKLLEHNVKKRLTAEEALNHQWMRKIESTSNQDAKDEVLIDSEAVRSAHKRVTGQRKQLNPKVEQLRNEKLQKIEEDFTKGVRHGHRLGETPKEDYMSKPEFLRRENKITTAPSNQVQTRRSSFLQMIGLAGGGKKGPAGIAVITEDGEEGYGSESAEEPKPLAKESRGRSASSGAIQPPRRLSYLPGITKQDETSFTLLYQEKSFDKNVLTNSNQLLSPIVPAPSTSAPPAQLAAPLPGTSPEKADEECGIRPPPGSGTLS